MDRAELIEKANKLAAERVTPDMDMDEKMDVLEMAMMELLDVQIMKPPIGRVGTFASGGPTPASGQWLMHFDPRLPEMPDKPTLMDFFRFRLMLDKRGSNHLLQSAKLAKDNGVPEKLVLACLLHDFSTVGFIRTDHGHWGAQIVAPYVDEEVAWAIKHHQSLRFLPAPELGYEYPKLYTRAFGEKYEPPEYIKAEWDYCRNHKWYMSAMQVVLNDLYAFDPNVKVELEEFEDIIGRNFKQPAEGLGFDGSPVAHMWRTMIWPNNFL
ncbi:MAG: HD domain-containing protein [Pseudomonadota bacterium]